MKNTNSPAAFLRSTVFQYLVWIVFASVNVSGMWAMSAAVRDPAFDYRLWFWGAIAVFGLEAVFVLWAHRIWRESRWDDARLEPDHPER